MPLGNPAYNYEDEVVFSIADPDGNEIELSGTIAIVDSYGIFADDSQVYYDIMVEEDDNFGGQPCLYKHIPEDSVSPA